MKITFALVATAAALALALTGCAGAPVPTTTDAASTNVPSTPSGTLTPTPEPTTTPVSPAGGGEVVVPAVAALRITGKGFSLEAADGQVAVSMTFYYDTAFVVDAISKAVGVTPVYIPNYEPPGNANPGPAWDFGGLVVVDRGLEGYAHWRYNLFATAPSIGSLAIVTPGGASVGDSIAEVTAAVGSPYRVADDGTWFSYNEPPYSWDSVNVSLIAVGTSTTITYITAPTGA